MTDFRFDLRVALRSLLRAPAFTFTALATLALGIGLTTAIFSLVQATLLRPLPFAEPERLVQVWESQPARGADRNVVGPGSYMSWKESARSFTGMSAFVGWWANIAGDGAAERIPIAYVSTDFLSTLGVEPRLGRGFVAADSADGAAGVALLSEELWRSRYGSDPKILGRTIQLNGSPATVVGVLDRRTDLPNGARLWKPTPFGESERQARGRYLQVVARLAPGVSIAAADAEMKSIAARLAAEEPDRHAGWSATVVPLAEQLVGDYRTALWVLLAATGAVLLVACANLSGLLLARNAGRRHELAVRGALGAGRGRLARQLLTEGLLLAGTGGLLALAVARGVLSLLRLALPVELPAFVALDLDGRVLAFALATSLVCGFFFSLLPALAAARAALRPALEEAGTRAVGRRSHLARNALVAGEVALSLALVAAAGLLVRSFATLRAVDPGFRTEQLLTARIDLAGAAYREPGSQDSFFSRLEERLAASSEIEAVGAISWLPLGGGGSATSYRAFDRPAPDTGAEQVADVRVVTPGFFGVAGVRLVAGRLLGPQDSAAAPPVVVLSEFAARELWPGEDPIGREIAMSWGDEKRARVVGVVADLHLSALDTEPRGALYWTLPQLPNNFMSVLVRPARDPGAAAAALREAVTRLDPTIPVAALGSMEEVVARGTQRQRFITSLLMLFAALGLTLAALGLYGLLAGSVVERRRELGLRMALGADGRRMVVEVLGRGLRTVAIGIALSVPLVATASRVVASLLYRTSPADPLALALAPLVLLAVAALACALPARRAARTDPATVLREG